MTVVALDFGRRRIGIAITDANNAVAYPVRAVERVSNGSHLELISAEIVTRDATQVVVGLPLNMDGSEGPAARGARLFAAQVAEATGLPVEMFDERLTSVEARERIRES